MGDREEWVNIVMIFTMFSITSSILLMKEFKSEKNYIELNLF